MASSLSLSQSPTPKITSQNFFCLGCQVALQYLETVKGVRLVADRGVWYLMGGYLIGNIFRPIEDVEGIRLWGIMDFYGVWDIVLRFIYLFE